jgi:hypothetical protein
MMWEGGLIVLGVRLPFQRRQANFITGVIQR